MRDPLSDTPSAAIKSITEHGGTNLYGKPYWRVVLAQNHTRQKEGYWHDGLDGQEQFTPDGSGKFQHNPLRPLRVVHEIRETPIFPVKGWILERWFPAATWGDPATWPSTQGPFPEQGEYWMLGGPWEKMPELHDLKQAISNWERERLKQPRHFEQAMDLYIAEEREAREAEERKQQEELAYHYKSEVSPIFKTISLEAQKIRNQCQAALGKGEHIGAGQ